MVIDLSHEIIDSMTVFPGDPPVQVAVQSDLATSGYTVHHLELGTHTGTHIDAPSHMIEGGKTLAKFGPETFIGSGVVIDVRDNDWSRSKLQSAAVQRGDIVLFCTGRGERFHEPDYFTEYPVIPLECAQFLCDARVKMVGLDTCSADNTTDFPVRKQLLGHDILIIENLAHLELLLNKPFEVIALPLPLKADGAPARVLARTN